MVEYGPKFTNAHGRALYLCTGQQGGGIDPALTDSVQVPMQALAARWLASFKEVPVRRRPASFNLDEVMAKLSQAQN